MFKQYFTQALAQIRQQPLMSAVSIFGTALAICLVMILVIVWRVKYASSEPEVNLERSLFISIVCEQGKVDTGINNVWQASPALMERMVKPVEGVEAATAISGYNSALLTSNDGSRRMKADYMKTDPDYWKIYPTRFLAGHPLTVADVPTKDMEPVVVCETVARTLFGRIDVVGETFLLNRSAMRIVGVTSDVSLTSIHAYAQVWRRYPLKETEYNTNGNGWRSGYEITILTRGPQDFDKVRNGVLREVAKANAVAADYNLLLFGAPDDAVTIRQRSGSGLYEPDTTGLYIMNIICILVILFVPALNLCGLSSSRMQQRMGELGVRKAFGSTPARLVKQILGENLILTLIGGVVGLFFSFFAIYLLREWLFLTSSVISSSGDVVLSAGTLFSPQIFLLGFLFCLLMNLLSAGIPAWVASRRDIVESLNDK